jgi:hypothetical protein
VFTERLLPKVEIPVLKLPAQRDPVQAPAAAKPEATPSFGPPDSVMEIEARTFPDPPRSSDSARRAELAGEYTGLAGVAAEIDKVMAAIGPP